MADASPIPVTADLIGDMLGRRLDGRGRQRDIIAAIAVDLPPLQAEFGLTTVDRLAHFLGQVAHESDSFRTTREYASGADYEGRADLGNTRPGDGRRYRGRGLIQVTGRANYAEFTRWARARDPMAADYAESPEIVEAFPVALLSALWFWEVRRLNAIADRDDIVALTRRINGGRNGLADRIALTRAARAALSTVAAGRALAGPDRPVLRRGMEGEVVELLQRHLRAIGFPLAIDGDFGPATELAVRSLQARHGLDVDGIVGLQTWSQIRSLGG